MPVPALFYPPRPHDQRSGREESHRYLCFFFFIVVGFEFLDKLAYPASHVAKFFRRAIPRDKVRRPKNPMPLFVPERSRLRNGQVRYTSEHF